jgi:hypothetical protein
VVIFGSAVRDPVQLLSHFQQPAAVCVALFGEQQGTNCGHLYQTQLALIQISGTTQWALIQISGTTQWALIQISGTTQLALIQNTEAPYSQSLTPMQPLKRTTAAYVKSRAMCVVLHFVTLFGEQQGNKHTCIEQQACDTVLAACMHSTVCEIVCTVHCACAALFSQLQNTTIVAAANTAATAAVALAASAATATAAAAAAAACCSC